MRKKIAVYRTNGTNGTNGANGNNGNDGHSPALTVKQDTDGRWYWCIDGVAMDDGKGGKVYATGDKGAAGVAGVDGVTPELKVETDPADGQMSWWVSYDNGKTWKKLGIVAGDVTAVAGLAVEYDEKNGTVTFVQGSDTWTFAYNAIAMSFSVDGEAVEAYSTIMMSVEESIEIEVAVEGASKNAVVKAELQNPGYGFEVFVSDNVITVDAVSTGSNKLLVEVQDGANCYHSWIELFVAPNAWVEVAGADEYGYMPVAFAGDKAYAGTDFSYLNNIPAELDVTLKLDAPAPKDITVELVFEDIWAEDYGDPFLGEGVVTMPQSITVKKGETSAKIPFSLNRAKMICDAYTYFDVVSDELNVEYGGEIWYANNFVGQVALTTASISNYFAGGNAGYLCDGNYGTGGDTSYSEADFKEGGKYYNYMSTIADWGVYIDVELPQAVAAVKFAYVHRSGEGTPASSNGEIGALRFGASNDGKTYEEIGTATQAVDGLPCSGGTRNGVAMTATESGIWNPAKVYTGKSTFSDVRFGVVRAYAASLSANAGADGYVDAKLYPWTSFNINELEVYVMY